MLVSSIIAIETYTNSSLNLIISLGPISCFHSVTSIIYIQKEIIPRTTTSDCG